MNTTAPVLRDTMERRRANSATCWYWSSNTMGRLCTSPSTWGGIHHKIITSKTYEGKVYQENVQYSPSTCGGNSETK